MNANIRSRNRHNNSTNAIHRFVKFVSLLSIIAQIDLGASFSLSSSSKSITAISSSSSSSTFTPLLSATTTTTLDSSANRRRLHVSSSSHTRRSLLTRMSKSDDMEIVEADSSNDNDDDNNDGIKIQNWLFALVIPLQLVYASNQLTRSSIYYLVDFSSSSNAGGDAVIADPFRAINVAIGFSEAQYGLLASLAFTALFAVASLGAGAAADKYDRKTLTVGSAVGWSVAIIGTALSTTYTEVLSWRIVMGLFCAFSTPTAYTLIAEKVPKDRLSLATSIYGTGVAFGGALASLSILVDNEIGWSQTLLIIGGVGLVCACLVGLVVPGDDSKSPSTSTAAAATIDVNSQAVNDNDVDESYSFFDGVSEALSTTRAKWIFGGSFLRFSSGLCIGVWSAPFFRAAFPDDASNYAVSQALITAVAGSVSGLAGGAAADYLSSSLKKDDDGDDDTNQDVTGTRLWIPVVGSLLAAPAWYLAIHSTESFELAMAWLTIEYLVAECWFGPTISTLLSTVPSKIGGTAQGLFTLTGAMANLSPTLLGYLYGQASATTTDGVEMSSSELLPVLLTTGVCFGYVSAAFCFAMGARSPPPPLPAASGTTTKSKSN